MSQFVADVDRVMVPPMDQYNQELINNVHPPDWVNPDPAPRYDLVVIGAGAAGLVTAAGAAIFGAKVALIEKHLMGGDCTIVGCVPSKAMIRSARVVADIQSAARFGIGTSDEIKIDFAAVMKRLRRVRAEISPNDSAKKFQQDYGVDVFFGEAKFTSADTVSVAGKNLKFRKAAIATGSRAAELTIDGLAEAGYLTNENVFELTERPDRLGVIGGGYVGCELAQTFRRLGSEVTLFQHSSRLLSRADDDAAAIIQQVFDQEGIQLILQSKITRVERRGAEKVIHYELDGREHSVTVDEILVGVGRSPNVENLNLETVGVDYDQRRGVLVNDYLQTTNPKIYAVGDICMEWKYTHAADAAARILIQNALFAVLGLGRRKLSSLVMPSCTFTDPEVATVGMSLKEAQQNGIEVHTLYVPMNKIDRAIIDGETEGFTKIYLQKGTSKIIGATIVTRHAGDMINEITLAMTHKLGIGALASTIHPYPTQAEAIRKAADEYSRDRLTPFIKKLASIWIKLRR